MDRELQPLLGGGPERVAQRSLPARRWLWMGLLALSLCLFVFSLKPGLSTAHLERIEPIPVSSNQSSSHGSHSSDSQLIDDADRCNGPFPGFPYCSSKLQLLLQEYRSSPAQREFYRARGVDGSKCSILLFLHNNGFFCPAPEDLDFLSQADRKIRGVNIGGLLLCHRIRPYSLPTLAWLIQRLARS